MTFLDIIELYNIGKGNELDDIQSIFADIDLDSRLDKEVLCGVLLDECGAMTSLYNTTPTFKYFSDNFFKKWKWSIKKLIDTMELEYEPLYNTNKEWVEKTQIEQKLDTAEGIEGSKNTKNSGTVENEYGEDEERTVSAMNSNDYEPDNKSEQSGTNKRTDNTEEDVTSSSERNKNEALTWDETDTHTEKGTVNQVVQDLIQKERKISDFSIYGWIANKYAKELFLMVY